MSGCLPSTANLLALRRRLSRDGGGLTEVEGTLRDLRREFLRPGGVLTMTVGGNEARLAAFTGVWHVLAQAPGGTGYSMWPLYINDALATTLSIIVERICAVERGEHDEGAPCHTILRGVDGAGKSTISRALVLAAAVLLDCTLPVPYYFTFSASSNSVVALLAAAYRNVVAEPRNVAAATDDAAAVNAADPYTYEGLSCVMAALARQNHKVLLVLDEFQHVFTAPDGVVDPRCVAVASHVAVLSCMKDTYLLLSGRGSADIGPVLFATGTPAAPDRWRSMGFPDMDSSLFLTLTVPAQRTAAAVRAFVAACYPHWDLDDADAAELLYWTGGVACALQVASEDMEAYDGVPVHGVAAAVKSFKDAVLWRAISLSDAARRVIDTIAACNYAAISDDAARERHSLPCVGMPYGMLLALLQRVGVADGQLEIARLADRGVLYFSGGYVQLTRPCDAHTYSSVTARHLMLMATVHFIVCGIPISVDGRAPTPVGCAGDGTGILRLLANAAVNDGASWQARLTDGAALQVLRPGGVDWEVATPALLAEAGVEVTGWPGEAGRDKSDSEDIKIE